MRWIISKVRMGTKDDPKDARRTEKRTNDVFFEHGLEVHVLAVRVVSVLLSEWMALVVLVALPVLVLPVEVSLKWSRVLYQTFRDAEVEGFLNCL